MQSIISKVHLKSQKFAISACFTSFCEFFLIWIFRISSLNCTRNHCEIPDGFRAARMKNFIMIRCAMEVPLVETTNQKEGYSKRLGVYLPLRHLQQHFLEVYLIHPRTFKTSSSETLRARGFFPSQEVEVYPLSERSASSCKRSPRILQSESCPIWKTAFTVNTVSTVPRQT